MWIVRIALDRPYTFIVLAILILVLSPIMILRTPTDIFPNINIPVIAVAWQFTGMSIFGKISVGVREIITGLRTKMSTARTMKVYGRSRATRTIHIIDPLTLESRTNRARYKNQMRPNGLLMQQIFVLRRACISFSSALEGRASSEGTWSRKRANSAGSSAPDSVKPWCKTFS